LLNYFLAIVLTVHASGLVAGGAQQLAAVFVSDTHQLGLKPREESFLGLIGQRDLPDSVKFSRPCRMFILISKRNLTTLASDTAPSD
jgi:hypothetical protein